MLARRPAFVENMNALWILYVLENPFLEIQSALSMSASWLMLMKMMTNYKICLLIKNTQYILSLPIDTNTQVPINGLSTWERSRTIFYILAAFIFNSICPSTQRFVLIVSTLLCVPVIAAFSFPSEALYWLMLQVVLLCFYLMVR